jgi:D-alanyl-D-alanine carboxypeptidase
MAESFHSAWIIDGDARGSSGAALDLFPWWSFTKTVLAVCALRLVEESRLELDALRPGKPYTLRHLLQHRAGVPDYGTLKSYQDAVAKNDTPWSRERLLQAANADQLLFQPGTGWAYSNIGYMFVADAIVAVTGLSLAKSLERLVLAPLSATSARLATEVADFQTVFWPEARTYDPRWVYHGCLIGTPFDAARILHALVSGQMLRSKTLEVMTERHELGGALSKRPWTLCGYGLGLMSGEMAGIGRAVGHSGVGPACVNAVYHFPDADRATTVAVFTDGSDEGPAEFEAVAIARPVG